jgi:hypothetical protein
MNTNGAAVETETVEQLDRANAVAIGRAEAYEEAYKDLMKILGEPGTMDVRILARVRNYVERTLPIRGEANRNTARSIKRQLAEAGR